VWPAPQPPQFVAFGVELSFSSTQAPAHRLYPLLQVNVQLLDAQVAWAWATLVMHAFPQVMQLFALLVVSTHVPLHSVGVLAGHPETHPNVAFEPEHTGVPPLQVVVQPPQCVGWVMSVSQPSAARPLQSAHPGAQEDPGNAHCLSAPHVVGPVTFASWVQSTPHDPQ
jgi:hypothetical protein